MPARHEIEGWAAALALFAGVVAGTPSARAEGPAAADPTRGLEWHYVLSPDEGFSAFFPAPPRRTSVISETIIGSIVATKFFVRVGGALFSVERHRLPKLSRFLAPSPLVLDRTRSAILSDRNAEEISYETPAGTSHPQRILVYRSRGSRFEGEEVHLHLYGRDLYLVTAESAPGGEGAARARRFLASFRLLDDESDASVPAAASSRQELDPGRSPRGASDDAMVEDRS